LAQIPLFSDGPAEDRAYQNIRDAKEGRLVEAREHCEALWALFEPYADAEFLIELRSNFDARYWEMYLASYFIDGGYKVHAPKPGPDIGIEFEGGRIWFEAVSPTRGADGHPDQVPEMTAGGGAQDVPNEKIVLRYLNSISEKYHSQFNQWIKNGTISDKDSFVIAINPRRIGFEYADTEPPRILQAAFTVGPLYVVINRETLQAVRHGYNFRSEISKSNGASVTTGVFQREEFSALSGMLCSRVDAANKPKTLGEDFQFVLNPHASVKVPPKFRLKGIYYKVIPVRDGYDVIPE
jgi:hypothetical protein